MAPALAAAAGALLLLTGWPAAAAPDIGAALRCLEMIALFDRIVQGRLDTRVLQIESWELAEARRLRASAEVDCALGNYWFGIGAIEDALTIVGVVPPTAFEEEDLD